MLSLVEQAIYMGRFKTALWLGKVATDSQSSVKCSSSSAAGRPVITVITSLIRLIGDVSELGSLDLVAPSPRNPSFLASIEDTKKKRSHKKSNRFR